MPARLRLSFDEVWAFLAVGLPVLAALLAPMSTVDLAYAIRSGQLMLESGTVLRTDPFTFTAGGTPWLDQQWGAQVLFGLGFDAGGWAAMVLVRAVLIGLTFGLVFVACRCAGAPARLAAMLTLAGFLVSVATLALRAQLLGIVCFALALALVAARERHPRLLWLVPVVTLAWANVHGSFVLGPALLAAALLDDLLARRPRAGTTAAVLVASIVATAITPFGPSVWGYAIGLTVDPQIRRLVTEWQPTPPVSFTGAVFYGSVALVVLVLVMLARRRRPLPSLAWLLWLGGLALLGVVAERGVAWWALGAPVVLAGILPHVLEAPALADAGRRVSGARRSAANGALVAVLVMVGVVLLPMWRGGDALYGPPGLLTDAPPGVTDALLATATPRDRLFAAQPWASWFELAVPDVPVFVDSRIEVPPASAWDDYLTISAAGAGWSGRLDAWGVSVVAASHAEQPALIAALANDPGWRRVHADEDGAVFVRVGLVG